MRRFENYSFVVFHNKFINYLLIAIQSPYNLYHYSSIYQTNKSGVPLPGAINQAPPKPEAKLAQKDRAVGLKITNSGTITAVKWGLKETNFNHTQNIRAKKILERVRKFLTQVGRGNDFRKKL